MDWTPVLTALATTLIGILVAAASLTPVIQRYIAVRLEAETKALHARIDETNAALGGVLGARAENDHDRP